MVFKFGSPCACVKVPTGRTLASSGGSLHHATHLAEFGLDGEVDAPAVYWPITLRPGHQEHFDLASASEHRKAPVLSCTLAFWTTDNRRFCSSLAVGTHIGQAGTCDSESAGVLVARGRRDFQAEGPRGTSWWALLLRGSCYASSCFIEEPWASLLHGADEKQHICHSQNTAKSNCMGLIVVAGLLLLVSAVRSPVLFCR